MRFLELPDGTFLDPSDIRAIRPLDEIPASQAAEGKAIPARVVIHHGRDGFALIADCGSIGHARAVARELAEKVSELLVANVKM